MEIIASGARDHVHRACVGDTGRKIEIRGRDLKLLHHFLGEAHLRAERSHRHDAAAIDRDPRSAASRSGIASGPSQNRHKHTIVVAAGRGLHARFEFGQLEKVAAVQRQALDLLLCDHAADGVGIVLHLRRGRVHGDRILHVADASA